MILSISLKSYRYASQHYCNKKEIKMALVLLSWNSLISLYYSDILGTSGLTMSFLQENCIIIFCIIINI